MLLNSFASLAFSYLFIYSFYRTFSSLSDWQISVSAVGGFFLKNDTHKNKVNNSVIITRSEQRPYMILHQKWKCHCWCKCGRENTDGTTVSVKDFVALVFVCPFSTPAVQICIIDNFTLPLTLIWKNRKIFFNLLSIEQMDVFQHFKLIIWIFPA